LKNLSIVRDYPITLSVAVNGLLLNFAAAFRAEVFAILPVLFAGAVLVRGRHTVTRMIVAAGVRATHHAKFHRFFSCARWDMAVLWQKLCGLAVAAFVPEGAVIELAGDDTAQRKTGAKIYGVGMVHGNRPHARKGWDLEWGLTWVTLTMMVRVGWWPAHVFALPVNVRLYRKEKVCRKGRRPFRTKPELLLDMVREVAGWLAGRRFRLHVDGGTDEGAAGEHRGGGPPAL
jgi:DDE superfamily endonuclease